MPLRPAATLAALGLLAAALASGLGNEPRAGAAGGGSDGADATRVLATPTATPAASRIDTSLGGELRWGSVTVRVPAGAITDEPSVGLVIGPFIGEQSPPGDARIGSTSFSVVISGARGRPILETAKPLSFAVSYTDADLSAAGGTASRLGLRRAGGNGWERLQASVDETARSVTGSTTSTGNFALTIEAASTAPTATATPGPPTATSTPGGTATVTPAAAAPPPVITGPPDGTIVADMGPLLTWTNPSGVTQYQLQVIPFANDGPGIDVIRNVEDRYQVLAPELGRGGYVLLPKMTYQWRVRVAADTRALTGDSPGWSEWASGSFRTPAPASDTISPVVPPAGGTAESLRPTLQWADADPRIFYYEVQVSKDPAFGTGTFLYWELVHGGLTMPLNSYRVPDRYPLQAKSTYYWRVRPRVQGDGIPVPWSTAWVFTTP